MHDLSAWKVLVVDDEPDNVDVVRLILEFSDSTVWSAASADECMALLEQTTPNILLIDIQMPSVSGIDLLARIRERDEWRDIPAVAVTAYSMEGDRDRILDAGFDGYLSKPITAMTLVDDLISMLDKKLP
ncbi:MAG: response regulator [Anaerolineae bacterium]